MIKASSDSKVRQFKTHKNSVGHTAISGCPEPTEGDGGCVSVCYADKLANFRPSVDALLNHNHRLLRGAKDKEEIKKLLRPTISNSEAQYERRASRLEGHDHRMLTRRGHIFRYQWSGDVITIEHAKAIRELGYEFPDTTFWLYTRTWWAVKALLGAKNVIVNLSVDPVNEKIMHSVWRGLYRHKNLRISWMASTNASDALDTLPKWIGNTRKALLCPENIHKLEVEGACHKCGLCLHSKNKYDVVFITKKARISR